MGEANGTDNTIMKQVCQCYSHSTCFVMFVYLQGDGVQCKVPDISDGVIQSFFNASQLRSVLFQKPGVVLQLDFCVYFCEM